MEGLDSSEHYYTTAHLSIEDSGKIQNEIKKDFFFLSYRETG